jgi:hypothetical protein
VCDAEVGVGRSHERPQFPECRLDRFGVATGEPTVGLCVDRLDRTAERGEELRAGERTRAVAGVQRDGQVCVGDRLAVDRREQLLTVRPAYTLDTARLAGLLPVRQRPVGVEPRLHPVEVVTGQLHAVGPDEFDTVELGWIVRRRHHHTRHALGFAVRLQCRRGHDTDLVDVTAHAGESARHRVDEQTTRPAGVPRHRDPVRVQNSTGSLCHLDRLARRERLADDSPDAARTEYLHSVILRVQRS